VKYKISELIALLGILIVLLFSARVEMLSAQDVPPQLPRIQLTDPSELTPRQYEIMSIVVTGAESHNQSFIIASASLNVGERITIPGQQIPDAVRRLFRTGLFSDVQILQTPAAASGVHLEIRVKEQPRLQEFRITGVRRSHRRELREQINLMSGFAVTESSKAQAVNIIRRYYMEKGYRGTSVDVITVDQDTLRNRVTLEFNVDSGDRIQIRDITFTGNETFSDRRLRRAMKETKQNTWWRLGRQLFKRDEFQESMDNLDAFYKQNGFRDFRVVSDTIFVYEHSRRRDGIAIHIDIFEGPQYFLRNITWEGNTVYTADQLTEALDMRKGDVFDEAKFQENLYNNKGSTDVFSLYHDAGYLFLFVEPDIREVPGDSLDLHFFIAEDEIATVRRVSFTGNTKTHDDVVRRNLRNIPGSNYNRSAIIRSIRELSTLGYFVPENIRPDLDPDPENKTVDIIYMLDESASTDNFEFSGGFGGRQFGVILSARVNFNNFSAQNMFDKEAWQPLPGGDGQRLSMGVQVTGKGYRNYNFQFTEPWFRGRPHTFSFGAGYSLYRFSSDSRFEQFSSNIAFGRRLNWPDDFFQTTSILQYQMFDVLRQEGFIEPGRAHSVSLRQVLERNSLDNFISPRFGSKFTLSAEVAPPVGQFREYYKVLTAFQHHVPLIEKLTFTNGIEFGYMGWFGDEQRSQFNRFYLGGTPLQQQQTFYRDNIDLKGFPGGFGGSITPFVDGQGVGGQMYTKYFTEMRYPLVATEQVQLIPYMFAEAGNAYLKPSHFDPFNVKRSAGFGMRVFLPILGLVDLSYGYRFDGIPGTAIEAGKWEFLFNIGAPF
jgi:outer membrane protein insertion porin family